MLQNEFTLDHATNGQEAIEKLKHRRYAAVLLDLLMPLADGYAVLDHLIAERPELLRRVLVVTAAITNRELQRVRDYPVCDVIAKPFEVETLLAAVAPTSPRSPSCAARSSAEASCSSSRRCCGGDADARRKLRRDFVECTDSFRDIRATLTRHDDFKHHFGPKSSFLISRQGRADDGSS